MLVISYCGQRTVHAFQLFEYLLPLTLWPRIQSIFVNIFCTFEKYVYSTIVQLFKSFMIWVFFYFVLCLLVTERGVVRSSSLTWNSFLPFLVFYFGKIYIA